ncbi:MAG: cob(I)yrinic acid a,c-diamide adenosyltransferase [Pirellulaceae bacterium]|nr:cob(I)yrinic acid a,c-diamide adenosyltransferase [Pirellulaceae bacterium]
MKIYTKTGDSGTTGLFGGPRVAKDDNRICAYGSIDEFNAVLGLARSMVSNPLQDEIIESAQNCLFSIGAELATPEPEKHSLKWNGESDVAKLEQWIDEIDGSLPPLKTFVLPGGTAAASYLHVARTVCRRAEREIVSFQKNPSVSDLSGIIIYLNRLSDLLFVMARQANALADVLDVPWPKKSP